jgi:hypothetical protein
MLPSAFFTLLRVIAVSRFASAASCHALVAIMNENAEMAMATAATSRVLQSTDSWFKAMSPLE